MRVHRFIGDFYLNTENLTVADPELIHQWKSVLRLSSGDQIVLADGKGQEADAIIRELGKKQAVLDIKTVRQESREPGTGCTLYASILRRENFELVVQKATEIGLAKIVPLISSRTVKTGFNVTRLQKIIREAAEQSGRTTLPELGDPVYFKEIAASINPTQSVLFDGSGSMYSTFNFQRPVLNIFIGPEGGFTPEEVAQAREAGITILSLGQLTLRAETAAIVTSFLATH